MGYHTRNRVTRYGILALVTSLVACSLSNLVDVDQPDTGGIVDEDVVTSYGGAVGMYYDALFRAADAVSVYSKVTALMTDELQKSSSASSFASFDALQLDETNSNGFLEISRARVVAERARGALGRYPNQAPAAYIGELFALEGYAHLLLAEGFCSGVPVTTVRYGEDIIYTAGSSREQLLASAIALFDSALVYGKDSAAVVTLARVGKGRARLNLADYTGAAEAVTNVPVTATYRMEYGQGSTVLLYWSHVVSENQNFWSVANAEGGNGLSWIAPARPQQDPRISLTTTVPVRQAKYPTSGVTTQVMADGIEARLIEAEAQLQPADNPNGPWLTTLNALRATLVNTAGARLLPDTTDPGTAAGRIKLLFYERAFWMYLTGHRQGDLRRLIRQYSPHSFSVATVYPQGLYAWQSIFGSYGSIVTLAPSQQEVELNPRYDGCFDREP